MKIYFSNKEVKVMESMLNEFGVEFANLESILDGDFKGYYAEDLKLANVFAEQDLVNIRNEYGHIITITVSTDIFGKTRGWWIELDEDFFADYMNLYRRTMVHVLRGISDLVAKVSFFVKPMVESFIKKWKKPEVKDEGVCVKKSATAKTPTVDPEVEAILDEALDELNKGVHSRPLTEEEEDINKFDPFATLEEDF